MYIFFFELAMLDLKLYNLTLNYEKQRRN